MQSGKLLSLGASTTRLTRATLATPAPSRGPSRWGGIYPLIHPGNWHRAWTQLHRLAAPPWVRYFLWKVMHEYTAYGVSLTHPWYERKMEVSATLGPQQ